MLTTVAPLRLCCPHCRGTYGNSIAESPSQSSCAGGGIDRSSKSYCPGVICRAEHSLDSDAEAKIVQLILIAGLACVCLIWAWSRASDLFATVFVAAAAIAIGELIHRLGKPAKAD